MVCLDMECVVVGVVVGECMHRRCKVIFLNLFDLVRTFVFPLNLKNMDV